MFPIFIQNNIKFNKILKNDKKYKGGRLKEANEKLQKIEGTESQSQVDFNHIFK